MKTMGDLIKRLIDEAFDTNVSVSIAGPFGDSEAHYDIARVELVEDDDENETGHRLVLYTGVTVDSRHRLEHDLAEALGPATPEIDASPISEKEARFRRSR